MIRRWEPILPGMRWLYGRARANQRSASGAGVSKPCGAVSTGGSSFSSPGFRSCKDMEGFLIRGWELFLPGVHWLYERSTANQRSASGPGVSTPFGAVSDRGITVLVPRLSEMYMYVWKHFSSRDENLSSPGCAGSIYDCQPISDRPVGLGFPHPAGQFGPGDHRFRPRFVGAVDVWRDF